MSPMDRRSRLPILFAAFSVFVACNANAQLSTGSVTQTTETVADWIGKLPLATAEGAAAVLQVVPDDFTGSGFQVKPGQFDPFKTYLVQAAWLHGTGCPTNATIAVFNAAGEIEQQGFTDSACAVGDPNDSRHEGLLLAKTGPTANVAAAFARIVGVKGITITELGWDIRKQSLTPGPAVGATSPLGSHCGAGAPRWNIETDEGFFFLGCNSPPAPVQFGSTTGWLRMRWGGAGALLAFNAATGVLQPVTGVVRSLTIIFDEGQDASGGPDQFGAAILDNISINGVMVGRGAVDAR